MAVFARLWISIAELIEDTLAIRIALLSDNTEYKQEPAYEHQDRIFGALTWNITDQLTFRGNVEHGTMNANRPRPIAPSEAISPWILLGQSHLRSYHSDDGDKPVCQSTWLA